MEFHFPYPEFGFYCFCFDEPMYSQLWPFTSLVMEASLDKIGFWDLSRP